MPYKPKYPFVATLDDGTEQVVNESQIFADDHPFVKKYAPSGAMIDIALTEVIPAPGTTYSAAIREDVEQATAAPGEVRRGPGRPRKEA